MTTFCEVVVRVTANEAGLAMFWSLGHFNDPAIDKILDREGGFTLEELLQEEDLLQECKAQNTKLLEYLAKPATLAKLVTYLTETPSESDSEHRRYRYPFVASEVLSCDVPALKAVLFASDGQMMIQLLSLLDQPAPLPPVLAGYCCKVLVARQKSAPETFAAFFDEVWKGNAQTPLALSNLLPKIVRQVGSDAILQMLIALCIGEPPPSDPSTPQTTAVDPVTSWLPHSELVPALLQQLSCGEDEACENAAKLLSALLSSVAEFPPALEIGRAHV